MPNRLADATSPYLLQHADNPVDWYPWGPEAWARARSEDRPVLLSIGYSACHWCHVMERESFEDEATAALMNAEFVNVKVDREERPDVDQVYMRAVQALTGGGGWPLTVFLTPAGEPYYGGTYFPPEPRHGMPSFRRVLAGAADAWKHRRGDVREAAERLVAALRQAAAEGAGGGAAEGLDAGRLERAGRQLLARYDPVHGGFGGAPKFPQPTTLELLLREHARTGRTEALDAVVHTLRRMAAGGLRDHLAGGFHRYSVDARWLVPHFEKMLYDNALLARLYLDAWRVSGAADLRDVAEQTLDWILAEMRDPAGGFHSALDADSEGEEGRFYVWTPEELAEALGDDAGLFGRAYDVSAGGNFEGRSILHLPHPVDAVAGREGMEPAELRARLDAARATLLARRAERVPPARDDKVLASWTGMTVRALAEAGAALERDDYLDAAAGAARFVLEQMRPGGRLQHVWARGRAHVPGFLEDYGAVGNALLTLHAATLDPSWLAPARELTEALLRDFLDPDSGLLHDTAADAEDLVVRPRDPSDGATPSGTSLAAELLARAGHLFGEEAWTGAARRAVASVGATPERHPAAFGRLLSVLDTLLRPPLEVAVIGPRGAAGTAALHGVVARRWLPWAAVAGRAPDDPEPSGVPLLEGRAPGDGAPTAWVCRRFACRAPVTTPEGLDAALDEALTPG